MQIINTWFKLSIGVVVTPDGQTLEREVGATTQGLLMNFVVFARGHSETSPDGNNENI